MFNRSRVTREEAYQALFDWVKNIPLPGGAQWGIRKRGIQASVEVDPANQPALFVSQGPERASQRRSMGVQTWEWWAAIVVFFRTDVEPINEDWEFANAILESIENVLYNPDGIQTLNGVVNDCFIEGEVTLFPEPNMIQQQQLFVPVVMLVGE